MEKNDLELKLAQEMESQGYTEIMSLRYYHCLDLVDEFIWSDMGDDMFLYGKSLGNITIFKIGKCYAKDFDVYDIEKIGNKTIYIEESNIPVQINARVRYSNDEDGFWYFNFIY